MVVATACLCAPAALARPATDVASSQSAHAAKAKKNAHAKKRLDKRAKARIRKQLQRELRRKPGSVFQRNFLKRASLVDFKLPLTIRLNRVADATGVPEASDDQIEITWDDSVVPWPLAGGMVGSTQISNLDGQFTVESSFSDSEGYGELGAMETILGGNIQMTATPFAISDFMGGCPSNPQLEVAPNTLVNVTSTGAKYGLMNLFSGDFRGSLGLRMTFSGQSWSGCGGTPTPTDTVDNSTAVQMPLRFQGNVRVSPAITADGKTRLGVLTVDDSVTPQTSTFAYVRACTGSSPCAPMQFPARLKVKKLRAEVLLGDAF